MTEIERKALELVNEVRAHWGNDLAKPYYIDRGRDAHEALCRAIERHEASRIHQQVRPLLSGRERCGGERTWPKEGAINDR